MNRADFLRLARLRLRDAKVLLEGGRPEAAYYLCGYAVECALKACIAKQTKRHQFPPDKKTIEKIYVHDLEKLVDAAGLRAALVSEKEAESRFDVNWSLVSSWSEQSRYEWHSAKEAEDLYSAVASGRYGVMRWLRKHW